MNWNQYQKEMWDEARLITEWQHEGLRYKAVEVPRGAIDEGSEEQLPALWVIGLNDGGVREYDHFFDPCFDRMLAADKKVLAALLTHAPREVIFFTEQDVIYE